MIWDIFVVDLCIIFLSEMFFFYIYNKVFDDVQQNATRWQKISHLNPVASKKIFTLQNKIKIKDCWKFTHPQAIQYVDKIFTGESIIMNQELVFCPEATV